MNALVILAWAALLLPLLSAAIITVFFQRSTVYSARTSITAVAASFLISGGLFVALRHSSSPLEAFVNWLTVGELQAQMGVLLDPLSLLMLLVVTGVGGLIHIYSVGYMKGERGFGRYFACLSLFTFSMLGIVLANNFVMMFVFWELVGVSSYLLIGFWYDKGSAADACKKAFLTNRLGDFGFLLGIIMIWATLGSVNFGELKSVLGRNPEALGPLAGLAGVLIFCGAMGKSAQFPLHVWLPDAMEGPTPVSALIHAATMVAAGVFMLCRIQFLLAPQALHVIAGLGGATALLAALIAVQQNDIKRILAYSTLSQLGYMIMAVGLGGAVPAMFHLTTHAFFKALLFLGAGSVILALHHEQDIWKMGGLTKKLPVTWWTFLCGTLALCGVPPFSGFYSKDEILAAAAAQSPGLFLLGLLVALLTTFYMFRLIFVAFLGKPRGDHVKHAHESPRMMAWPLRLLAVASIFGGFFGIKPLLEGAFGHPAEGGTWWGEEMVAPFVHAPVAALGGLVAVAIGLGMAWLLYSDAKTDPLPEKLGSLARAMRNKFYFDELYERLIAVTHEALSYVADFVDRWFVAGAMVRSAHGTTELLGRTLRLVQTGNLQTYALLFSAGLVLILYLMLRTP